MIAIIDYQTGKPISVKRALDALSINSYLCSDPERLSLAKGIILPGSGSAGQAMKELRKHNLDASIKKLSESALPLLGICLGGRLMLEKSAEIGTGMLGIFKGESLPFSHAPELDIREKIKMFHMGWNNIALKLSSPLVDGLKEDDQFYFIHNYYPNPQDALIMGTSKYGIEFPAVFGRDGLWAVQFHPEKSGEAGLRILENFYRYCMR